MKEFEEVTKEQFWQWLNNYLNKDFTFGLYSKKPPSVTVYYDPTIETVNRREAAIAYIKHKAMEDKYFVSS